MRVRQSTLSEADKCLRSLQYSLESNTYHGGVVRAIGTAYHAGLEFAYDARIATDSAVFPDLTDVIGHACDVFIATSKMAPSHASEFDKVAGNFLWDDKFPTEVEAMDAIDRMLRAYFLHPEAPWPSDWTILACEQSFHLPLWGGHTKDGSVDLVLRDPNGFIVGEDHKTAGKKWPSNKHHARKGAQSPWYLSALMELYPDAPGYRFFYDIMTYGGPRSEPFFERREVTITPEHVEATEAKALSVVTLVEGMKNAGVDLPGNPGSTLCSPKWCDHFSYCPHGAQLDVQ